MQIKPIIFIITIMCFSGCGKDSDPQSFSAPHSFSNPPVTNQDEWIVNTNDYQDFMTVVAEIHLDGEPVCNASNILAGFKDSEIRGVTEPYSHLDCVLYNLIIYSNNAGETITFGAYLSDENRTVSCTNEITFEAGLGLGTPDTPYIIEIK